MKNPKNMNAAELEALLNEKRNEEREALLKKKSAYEVRRNKLVRSLCASAEEMSNRLKRFKDQVMSDLGGFQLVMKEYSTAKKEGKGNFELLSEDGTLKVEFSVQAKKAFDERAGEAEQLLKEFLKSVIKGRNSEAYKLVSTLLERKIDGDYDIKLIQRLYKMENDYDNETWRRAIQLFKEAYKEIDSARYVRFYKKTDSGPWTLINLSFSGL